MRKSTLASLILVLVLIPLTLFLGTRLHGRWYYLTSTLIIIETMIPFFLAFETRKPQARELVTLSVLCALDQWQALLTGDMPEEEEALLAARERLPDGEVLIAGHHGSKYSTGPALLTAFQPETVVISVGYNTYGHPAPELLERLEEGEIQVYRTDRQGTVTVYAQNREEP